MTITRTAKSTRTAKFASAIRRLARSDGQATVEYALVLLAAAGLAAALLAWAVGSDGVSRLLNAVVDSIINGVTNP